MKTKKHRQKRTTDDKCQIDALKNLSLLDLIEAAEKSKDCSKVAAEVFQDRYANKSFVIEKHSKAYDESQDYDSSVESISDLQVAKQMINHFGHLIQKLDLMFDRGDGLCELSTRVEIQNVLIAIDEHCRESLVEFALVYRGCNASNVFNQIQGPFGRIENLTSFLYDLSGQTVDHHVQLNAVFPNVRKLVINLNHNIRSSLEDCEFPKLEILDISSDSRDDNEPIFIDLLKKNPQITKLTLNHQTLQALRNVQKYSTHLEDLNIKHMVPEKSNSGEMKEETYDIQFHTVEHLYLWIGNGECRPPNGILFNETLLREIDMECDSGDPTDAYLNFLFKHPKIQKLIAARSLHSAHLMKLIGKLPELAYAAFDFHNDVGVDNIVEFVKQTPSLNQLEFLYENNEKFETIENLDVFVNELKMKLDTNFNVKFTNVPKRFSVERKNQL